VLRIRNGFNANPDQAFFLNAYPDPDQGGLTNVDPGPGQIFPSLKVESVYEKCRVFYAR
jgi:hypothetical protein